MAPRRDSAAQDQLPQPGYATDGRPSGDLQPGTQRKQAASSDSARRAAQAVALAVGVTSLPGSPESPRTTVAASNVGLCDVPDEVLCSEIPDENDVETYNDRFDEAEVEAAEALLTLQRLRSVSYTHLTLPTILRV